MIKNFLYIKYGELYLKGKNKNYFINMLYNNVKQALFEIDNVDIMKEYDNIKIFNYNNDDEQALINIIKKIPGIDIVIPAVSIQRDIYTLNEQVSKIIKNGESFKINCRRKDKSFYFTSEQIIREVASYVLKNKKDCFVDIHNPQNNISLEVNNNSIIIFSKKIKCVGGFPVGVNSRCLLLISGGIDSPVAGHLLQKKGMLMDYITFITPPYTSEKSLDKTKDLIRTITINGKIQNSRLFVINFTPILHELNHIKDSSYKITLMRRSFFRISQSVCQMINAQCIATGESIGQVASQTLASMDVISNAIDCLIFRPLLTFDKKEIIDIAKDIGTYDISIRPYDDSCSLFAPKNPTTKPNIKKVLELENELFLLTNIENSIIDKIKKEIDYVQQ